MDKTTTIISGQLVETYNIPKLPPPVDFETRPILRALKEAHKHLAELRGRAGSLPNQGILIDTLTLQEAAASSEIENIVTTQDELYQMNTKLGLYPSPEAKEVALYGHALRLGFEQLQSKKGNISNNTIIALFQTLKRSTGEYRKTPGTALKNDKTGAIVYVPPQSNNDILTHMDRLEAFINEPLLSDIDPLVAMAIIHHQFESIHPFPDGNGRIGRIINVLFLCKTGLLEIPILYLSRFITKNKSDYYHLLQYTRDTGDWEPWILYILKAASETAQETTQLIYGIRNLMAEYKKRLREDHPKIYSQELINNLFRHPYTRIEYVVDEVGVSRQTAGKYLNELEASGLLNKMKVGLNNYYINGPLVQLLAKP
jgi:Fic family protein